MNLTTYEKKKKKKKLKQHTGCHDTDPQPTVLITIYSDKNFPLQFSFDDEEECHW